MELQTQRLKLIPCTAESISTISIKGYEIGPHIKEYLKKLKDDSTLLGWGVWLVIEKENDSVIGDIGFKGKPDSENAVEVGYGILPSAQNKGYATEAVREIIKWAFTFENVTKVIAECRDDNGPSIRVLEKLNMNRIGSENNMLKWELQKGHA
ncbi:GNAT family N-acetyltransferase [Siminovitchia fortis]|uniref:N-acetyltransferase n=1 Tax=Siminovitchia fortis TaxID=254758 RepID=A0A443IKY5_9BACI|nr:GNAT family N-acetyltransferase [Siminovitchia fortis]RWR05285.1 N-acetyltransferase [Siminovitchia fortis]WHY82431.1 GNAT family N-acetyltransferase [Siminovitchia fortis]